LQIVAAAPCDIIAAKASPPYPEQNTASPTIKKNHFIVTSQLSVLDHRVIAVIGQDVRVSGYYLPIIVSAFKQHCLD
jgi:hypothetical protein